MVTSLRAQPQGGAGRVDGRVAAADDHDPVAQVHLFAQGHRAQEGHAVEHALGLVLAGDAQLLGLVGANGQKDGGEALVKQLVDVPDGVVELQLDAQAQDLVDLAVQHLVGQAVGRDADPGHAASHRQRFKDGDLVAHARQKVGRGETRRTGADDGHAPLVLWRQLGRRLGVGVQLPVLLWPALPIPLVIDRVGDEALEGADGHRAVQLAAVALGLAGMVADAAHGRREGVVLLDDLQRLLVALLGDEGDVALGAGVGRAGGLAGAGALLGDDISAGNGLGIGLVDGRALWTGPR